MRRDQKPSRRWSSGDVTKSTKSDTNLLLTNLSCQQNPTMDYPTLTKSLEVNQGTVVEDSLSDSCQIMFRQRRVTNFEASMHILKISIGSGILAMPAAVRDNGLFVGCLGIVLISLLMIHTCNLLVKCSKYLRHKPHLIQEEKEPGLSHGLKLDYARLVYHCVRLGPPCIQRHTWLASFIQGLLIYAQFGTLCVYTLFLGQNLKYWLREYHLWFEELNLVWFQLFVAMLLLMLVFVKTLHHLAVFSVLANICGIVSLLLCVVYCVTHLYPSVEEGDSFTTFLVDLPLSTSLSKIFLLFGVVVYAFETINILIPLEDQMIEPDNLGGSTGVMNTSMLLAIALYVAVGFFGYACFKEKTETTIIYSMPTQPWYWMLSKPLYIFTFFVTYCLQFYVLFQILWDKFKSSNRPHLLQEKTILCRSMKKSRFLWSVDAVLRVSLVLICFTIASVIPRVDLLISFVGASSGMGLSLIFPSLSHICITWHAHQEDTSRHTRVQMTLVCLKNGLIVVLGLIGLVTGTYVSLQDLIANF